MVEIKYALPAPTSTETTLSVAGAIGDTTITVASATSLSNDDYILLEERGHEYAEVRQIASIASNVLTLDAALTRPHAAGQTVTKLTYNQYRIEESNDNSTWTTLVTDDLDYTDPQQKIIYEHTTWSSSKYYRISYYNEETSTAAVQATQQGVDNFGWISLADLRAETSIPTSISNDVLIEGIKHGVEWIKSRAFRRHLIKTGEQDTTYTLDLDQQVFADWDASGTIDVDDFLIYQEDTNGIRTYLPHKVAAVFHRSSRVLFSSQVPASTETLVFWAPTTFKEYDKIKSSLRYMNKLLAINYMLQNVPISKLATGSISWTAGGTTVNLQPDAIQSSVEANNKFIQKELQSNVLGTYMRSSKLRHSGSQFRREGRVGTRFQFRTQGGNTHGF